MVAAGVHDPTKNGKSSGVENIMAQSREVKIVDVRVGDAITFNTGKGPYSHIGIITGITKDKNGNITTITFIASGGQPGSGDSGPKEHTFTVGDKSYFDRKRTGFFQWDTPDTPTPTKATAATIPPVPPYYLQTPPKVPVGSLHSTKVFLITSGFTFEYFCRDSKTRFNLLNMGFLPYCVCGNSRNKYGKNTLVFFIIYFDFCRHYLMIKLFCLLVLPSQNLSHVNTL